MNAVGLQQATVAGADFLGDVAAPPVGGQPVAAVLLRGGVDGDIIRAFQLDDMGGGASDARVAPALSISQELEAEFDGGVAEGVKIPDLGLDGGEVTHGFMLFVFMVGVELVMLVSIQCGRAWQICCEWISSVVKKGGFRAPTGRLPEVVGVQLTAARRRPPCWPKREITSRESERASCTAFCRRRLRPSERLLIALLSLR